jgi:hypothetical protein
MLFNVIYSCIIRQEGRRNRTVKAVDLQYQFTDFKLKYTPYGLVQAILGVTTNIRLITAYLQLVTNGTSAYGCLQVIVAFYKPFAAENSLVGHWY